MGCQQSLEFVMPEGPTNALDILTDVAGQSIEVEVRKILA
jgi:hypothetical protein